MKVRVHGKNLPKKFRLGVYGMAELTMRDLLDNRRIVNNLEIDIHFRHHADNGEAMIHENEFRSRPRMFRVIIDPYKTRIDDYGREMDEEEHANEITFQNVSECMLGKGEGFSCGPSLLCLGLPLGFALGT